MESNTVFHFQHSAKENAEVQEIRKKYTPQQESKLKELKRLDHLVQSAGINAALCVGIVSSLVIGAGMCHAMQVPGAPQILKLAEELSQN